MEKIILIISILLSSFLAQSQEMLIGETINNWHKAAANADFERYFSHLSSEAIFIGTDPTEYWSKEEFKSYAKPYFDKSKTWNFKAIERNIFLPEGSKTAWFDELLETQMGLCRGSGILKLKNNTWKIEHYVLSITVPNENTEVLTKMKRDFDEKLIKKKSSK